ncbi:MAG: porin [Nostocaceae cyanobacterium]|nr:porin [Nostocaceae cyanobacterium]
MIQKGLVCHKFTFPQRYHNLYLRLCVASFSLFWLLVAGEASLAQVNYSQQSQQGAGNFQLGLGGALPVPKPPKVKKKSAAQNVPPAPGTVSSNTGNFTTNRIQQVPLADLKQQENTFIQQPVAGDVPKATAVLTNQNQLSGNTPLAIGGDSSDVSFGLQGAGGSYNNQQFNAPTAPLPPLPGSPATVGRAAPTPTFNQLLNGQNAPSVPNYGVRRTTPTYSQQNNQAVPSVPGYAATGATPTYNQQFNNQAVPSAPGYAATGATPTFNQLLNGQNAPSVPNYSATGTPTFNQQFNTQVAPLPPLPGSNPTTAGVGGVPTFNQLLNAQVNSVPPFPGTTQQQEFTAPGAPTFNQMFNAQPQTAPLPPTYNQPGTPQYNTTPAPAPIVNNQPAAPQTINDQKGRLLKSTALGEPSLFVQGVYITQGGDTTARARLSGVYPLTPQVLFGATFDLTSEDSSLDDSRQEGLSINELYLATSLAGLPNLRFVVGQLDLTSYFDRNSFAKDGASHFFNPVFQTNPALSSTGISSHPGLLVNWSLTDNIDAKAAVFSSSDKLSDFSFDGFAGEIGVRYGNAIIRGTYATARDAGNNDSFAESFGLSRGDDRFGILEDDREEAYGINAEVFIPNSKIGLFGRYGRYENRDLAEGADTYMFGISLLDVLNPDDRLGLAYGRALSNDRLRRGADQPDVLELYYDFKFLPNLRLGFTVQGRDEFEETVVGVRVKSEFDVTPKGRLSQ